jgi:hypothetical protein
MAKDTPAEKFDGLQKMTRAEVVMFSESSLIC